MNMKNLKWAQVVLLALLILLPKQISAYQKKVLLSPTRNYTIHGRIVDSFTNLPISNVKLTLLSADSTVIVHVAPLYGTIKLFIPTPISICKRI